MFGERRLAEFEGPDEWVPYAVYFGLGEPVWGLAVFGLVVLVSTTCLYWDLANSCVAGAVRGRRAILIRVYVIFSLVWCSVDLLLRLRMINIVR